MFNRQLRQNIKALDAQIGELSKELDGLKKDTKYDVKMTALKDLAELRSTLTKNQGKDDEPSDVVIELDKRIEELTKIVSTVEIDEVYTAKLQKLEELTKIRGQLTEAKSRESNAPALITIAGGLTATLLVLHYEKVDVITSKAFGMATSLFRGR